jgi:hypothetical protein
VAESNLRSVPVMERKYGQQKLGEGFIHDNFDDCWEPWMKKEDEMFDGEQLRQE